MRGRALGAGRDPSSDGSVVVEEPGRAIARGIVPQAGAGSSLWEQEIPTVVLLRASHPSRALHTFSLPRANSGDGKEGVGILHSPVLLHSIQAVRGWDWFAPGFFKFEEFLACLELELLL